MKTLYFDCFAGASGDMILGAMVAAGVDPDYLKRQLSLLNVEGFSVDFETVKRSGLSARYVRVETSEQRKHRHLADVKQIIEASGLSDRVKQGAVQIFTRLAAAEADAPRAEGGSAARGAGGNARTPRGVNRPCSVEVLD